MADKFVLCRWRVNDLDEPKRYCGLPLKKAKAEDEAICSKHLARLPIWPN